MTVRELEAWAIAHPNMPQANAVLELIAKAEKLAVENWHLAHGAESAILTIRDRVKELEAVLRKIQAWELLNPPRVDLLPDLGWLKAVVMKVNLGPAAEVPGAQPNES